MPLQDQVISIPFADGLDTKTDEKLIAPGSLSDVSDGVYTKGKTIDKRNGYSALSANILGGGTISSANKLGKRADELLLLNNDALYSYSQNSSSWVNKGMAPNCELSSELVANTKSGVTGPGNSEITINGSIKVVAWFEDESLYASVFDTQTGVQYQSSTLLRAATGFATNETVRLLSISNYIYAFYIYGNIIYYRRLDTTSPATWAVEASIVASGDVRNDSFEDFDVIPYGSEFILTYSEVTANLYYVAVFSSTAVFSRSSSYAGIGGPISVCFDSSDNNIYVVTTRTTGELVYFRYDSALTAAYQDVVLDNAATSKINLTCTVESAGTLRTFYNVYSFYGGGNQNNNYTLITQTVTGANVVGTASTLSRQLCVIGKAFTYSSKSYVLCGLYSPELVQGAYYLVDSTGNNIARSNWGRGVVLDLGAVSRTVCSVVNPTAGTYQYVSTYLTAQSGVFPFRYLSQNVTQMSFNLSTNKVQSSVEINNTSVISGAYPSLYDGNEVSELGFNYYPETIESSLVAAGGPLQIGTYTYYAVFEWIDGQGNKHRSSPSAPKVVTVTANNSLATIRVPTLRLTGKSGVSIVVYRTALNGTIPYRLQYNAVTGTSNPMANSQTVDYLDFIDQNTDAGITDNEILYTTGGVLENDPPPSFKQVEIFKNRLILSGIEEGKNYWYSKTILPGEGPSFSAAFYERVDTQGDDIVSTKVLDDKLIIFKDNLLFAVAGDGPNDLGQQNSFTNPQLISSDVGGDPGSVVLMPAGLMFKTNKGVYLLDRSLQVKYIGAAVEAYNSQDVSSAILLEDKNQIRFLTSSGRTLMYDYFFDKWNTFLNHAGVDSVIWNGTYTYLRTNGVVYTESATYADNGTAIVLKPTTPWIKLSSVAGFQRVREVILSGNYYSAHTLTVKVYYDYNNSTFDSYTFSTATGVGADGVYQFRIKLKRQKCEAIKFQFDDSVAAAPGRGYSVNDLALEIGLKRGLGKLPASKTVG